jgi:hypothetical protein
MGFWDEIPSFLPVVLSCQKKEVEEFLQELTTQGKNESRQQKYSLLGKVPSDGCGSRKEEKDLIYKSETALSCWQET